MFQCEKEECILGKSRERRDLTRIKKNRTESLRQRNAARHPNSVAFDMRDSIHEDYYIFLEKIRQVQLFTGNKHKHDARLQRMKRMNQKMLTSAS